MSAPKFLVRLRDDVYSIWIEDGNLSGHVATIDKCWSPSTQRLFAEMFVKTQELRDALRAGAERDEKLRELYDYTTKFVRRETDVFDARWIQSQLAALIDEQL